VVGIEDGSLAYLGQTDDAAGEAHMMEASARVYTNSIHAARRAGLQEDLDHH
jgi:hypothetical protein